MPFYFLPFLHSRSRLDVFVALALMFSLISFHCLFHSRSCFCFLALALFFLSKLGRTFLHDLSHLVMKEQSYKNLRGRQRFLIINLHFRILHFAISLLVGCMYRVSHFKSCTEIFLQRSIFRKNVSDKSCLVVLI